jgi:hypothetical protein
MTRRRGKKRRRRRRPYRQGDLDGLCGVYSIINAARALCTEIDANGATWLFGRLMQSLRKAGPKPSYAVATGIGRGALIALLRDAMACIEHEYGVTLTARRLPEAQRQIRRLDDLWQTLADAISPTSVAVLGLGGKNSHWTVAVKISAKQIKLFDSSRMGVLRRADCSIREIATHTAIAPAYVIVVTRKAGD